MMMLHPLEFEFSNQWYQERSRQLQKQAEYATLVREAREANPSQPFAAQRWFGFLLIKWGKQLSGRGNADADLKELSVEVLNKISIKISL